MRLDKVDYDDRQHAVYAQGRALTAESVRLWRDTFARWAPPQRPLTVLDVGSGTGRFTPLLTDLFGGPVYGVEPSGRMRQAAAGHPGVSYLPGSAERIPLADGTCDLVLMFLVLQHVADRPAATREIRRVLRPGGRVLIRSTFTDRMPELVWHRYFPRARAIERELFPSHTETEALFTAAGLRVVALDRVREQVAPSLAEYARRLELRAISIFEYLTEDEIQRGFAALRAAVEADPGVDPVELDADLLVLEGPPATTQQWTVWRQDDNGNRYEVSRHATRAEAEAVAATLEARGHKQTYWVSERI